MKRFLAFLFLFVLVYGVASGQIFRYRLSANGGVFLGEPGKAEIDYPMKDELSHPGSEEFSAVFKPGVELEIMAPVTPDFELGLQFGYLLGGSILVETVFSWPGTGYLLNTAIFQRDIPLLQGIILVLAMFFVGLNLLVDVLQTLMDPRIKRG